MTMTTHVRINHPINPERLLDELTRLCGGDPGVIERLTYDYPSLGMVLLFNNPGQGLRALCKVHFHPDGPIPEGCPDWFDTDRNLWPTAIVECSFDTPYGARYDNGGGVDDFHRWVLDRLIDWFVGEGVSIDDCWWFAGEYLVEYARLSDLSAHGGDPHLNWEVNA